MPEITDAEHVWHTAFANSPIGMGLLSTRGRWLALNSAMCAMFGRSAEELEGLEFADYTHPDDLHADDELVAQCFRRQIQSYRVLKRYFHADGSIVLGDLSVALVRDDDDKALYFIVQILDMTRQHDSEQRLSVAIRELEEQRQLAEATFESVDIGLCQIGGDGRFLRTNRAHEGFLKFGFPDGFEGVAGQMGWVYHADGVTPLTREEMPSVRAIAGEEYDDQQIWVGPPGGNRRALSVSSRCVRDDEGTVLSASLAFKDVTELMMALQVKEEFVSSVSHELRTPLTSVLGYLEMLRERDDLPPDAQTALAVVERNSMRLKRLVSDLLEAAAGREGDLQIHRTDVDLVHVARDVLALSRPTAEAKSMALKADLPESLTAYVDGDRFRQILDNLVSNAFKYTPPGGVVTVRLARQDGSVELVVSDTGMGFEPGHEDKVFSRFYRGRQVRALQIQGTGLGLSIVHAIARLHGGAVSIASDPSWGSEVRVVLPEVKESALG